MPRDILPWLLGSLSLLPAFLLSGAAQYSAIPVAIFLVAFGYWLIWPHSWD